MPTTSSSATMPSISSCGLSISGSTSPIRSLGILAEVISQEVTSAEATRNITMAVVFEALTKTR